RKHGTGTAPGLRLRPLRAGARSSLTERLLPHEKRGPGREIAVLERCEAPASRKGGKTEGPMRLWRSGPLASLNEARPVMEECPDALKQRGRGGMEAAYCTVRNCSS